jgi:hypothetical protein
MSTEGGDFFIYAKLTVNLRKLPRRKEHHVSVRRRRVLVVLGWYLPRCATFSLEAVYEAEMILTGG